MPNYKKALGNKAKAKCAKRFIQRTSICCKTNSGVREGKYQHLTVVKVAASTRRRPRDPRRGRRHRALMPSHVADKLSGYHQLPPVRLSD